MPRRLPWLQAEPTTLAKPPRQKPSRTHRQLADDNAPPRRRQTSRIGTLARAGRTPSTSPPPTPPSNELMHDGLDGDDIYIMVEDEFHAVAKMFTQHLHHAEYLRLNNLAKSRTASTASTISRPIDSITAMRNETEKKKQAEARDARTQVALQKTKGATRPASDDSALSDADNAHWRGTALQGLMMVSPTKNEASLAGLHGVKSSTRAAAGYSKAESRPSHPRAKAIDLRPNSSKPTSSEPALPEGPNLDESSTDDLDAPIATPQLRASKPPRIPVPHTLQSSPPPKVPLPPHHKNPPSPSRLKHRRTPHSYPTPDSDSDSGSASAGNSSDRTRPVREAARRRIKARIARRETEGAKRAGVVTEGGGAEAGAGGGWLANANDIPVFLV